MNLLVVAGEASGDLHGAHLLAELTRVDPRVAAFGLGGDRLVAEGLDAVARSREIAVVGLFEALEVLPRAWQIYRRLLAEVERRRPRAAVLIDFPEFNLRLASALKKRGVPVVYYVSPQIWAWRRGRVAQIADTVDRMLVLFRFEVDFYRQHGVDAVYVGHHLVDEVPLLPHVWDRPRDAGAPLHVGLLPGSRGSELRALLPTIGDAARRLARDMPTRFTVFRASTVERAELAPLVEEAGLPVSVAERGAFEELASCHLAICASGTATLEVGLTGTPMIVVYRVGRLTYQLGRLLVKLPYASLVNLVLEEPAVPELMQHEANAARIASEAQAIVGDAGRVARMRSSLARLRPLLGPPGAARRAAAEVAGVLGA